jgi:hypothetical protein
LVAVEAQMMRCGEERGGAAGALGAVGSEMPVMQERLEELESCCCCCCCCMIREPDSLGKTDIVREVNSAGEG